MLSLILQKLKDEKIRSRIFEILRYGAGCGCSLLIKTGLTVVLKHYNVSLQVSYLIAHSFLIFSGFFYHYFITFRSKFEGLPKMLAAFWNFATAVILLKMLDYFIVTGSSSLLKKHLPVNKNEFYSQVLDVGLILLSSVFIFILRFFIYRFILKKKPKHKSMEQLSGEKNK